jgi:hypothetical protein
MSDKIAGIDVHKKVLMVVVVQSREGGAICPECKPERRRFGTTTSELRRLSAWLPRTTSTRSLEFSMLTLTDTSSTSLTYFPAAIGKSFYENVLLPGSAHLAHHFRSRHRWLPGRNQLTLGSRLSPAIRSTGTGWALGAGRVGTIAAPSSVACCSCSAFTPRTCSSRPPSPHSSQRC